MPVCEYERTLSIAAAARARVRERPDPRPGPAAATGFGRALARGAPGRPPVLPVSCTPPGSSRRATAPTCWIEAGGDERLLTATTLGEDLQSAG